MKITIHKEGWPVIVLVFFLLLTIVVLINIFVPHNGFVHYLLYLAGIVFYIFVIRFFRHPLRPVVPDPNIVLCGADGKVVVIEEVIENEYFKSKRKQVSVFMSPTNVHVNWSPAGGVIKYFRHIQGWYFIASKPKSSHENERTTVVIETENKEEIMFRQIAGTVARRIVCYAKEGKKVKQGDEIGIIKFGSRFDIFLPVEADIKVKIGDKVAGNQTIIARLGNDN
ncbi:MAG: phosphatidylserine decarboxylase family protein [Bacteroidales bacterium]|nr:phosphatidylserine decarboxylase family protein [Bacteroidales bacterium]MCF8403628.1 phosphatidylserine decarboxylase family protein [Bacteroidales bacterium]